jgi:broad specificity phosphatase PhoE
MSALYLVRHGESISNMQKRFTGQTDSPLTPLGHQQANLAAGALVGCGAKRLIVSSLVRAQETAQPIAEALNLRMEIVPEIQERNFGRWENITLAELEERYPDDYAVFKKIDFDFRPEEGESIRDIHQRIVAWFEANAAGLFEEGTVIVSHGGSIIAMLKHVMNLPYDHHLSLLLDNSSITELGKDLRDDWRIMHMNIISHLSGARSDGFRDFMRKDSNERP